MSRRHPPARATPRPRPLPLVYRRVFHALDAVLEEGVARETLAAAGLATREVEQWAHSFGIADAVVEALRPALRRPPAEAESAAPRMAVPSVAVDDPALVRLMASAAAIVARARAAALSGEEHPALAALERAVALAFAHARVAQDEQLAAALAPALRDSAA